MSTVLSWITQASNSFLILEGHVFRVFGCATKMAHFKLIYVNIFLITFWSLDDQQNQVHICCVCWFPCHKYSYKGQDQVTNKIRLKPRLAKNTRPHLRNKLKSKRTGDMIQVTQVVECKALSLIPSTTKKRRHGMQRWAVHCALWYFISSTQAEEHS
jgi:hypothetical protein